MENVKVRSSHGKDEKVHHNNERLKIERGNI